MFLKIKSIPRKLLLQIAITERSVNVWIFNLFSRVFKSLENCKILPLVGMDEFAGHQKELLTHRSTSISFSPHFLNREVSTISVNLPDIYCHIFRNSRISVLSSSVILNDDLLAIDRAVGSDQKKYDYSAGHILKNGIRSAVVRLPQHEDIEKGIFLGGNGSFNYYHWIVEIISKSQFLPKLPEVYKNYPLLVSEDVISIPSFKEILDIFLKKYDIIVLKKNQSYIVDTLIYITSPNSLPFNILGNSNFNCSYVGMDKFSIEYLRKIILDVAYQKWASGSANYSQRIFLCRKNVRRNYNQEEVFTHLATLGFTKLFFEDLSFMEQVRVIQNADFIVGPTGAAWANLIFCKAGAKGLCWMAEEINDFAAYSTIAKLVGTDLRYITYKAGVRSTDGLYNKDYTIDLNMLRRGLYAIGLSLDNYVE